MLGVGVRDCLLPQVLSMCSWDLWGSMCLWAVCRLVIVCVWGMDMLAHMHAACRAHQECVGKCVAWQEGRLLSLVGCLARGFLSEVADGCATPGCRVSSKL